MNANYETDFFDAFLDHRNRSFFYKGRSKIINALLNDKVASGLRALKTIRIVDLGFGHGTKIQQDIMGKARLVGVDINLDSLSRIKKIHGDKNLFVNADILALPFKKSFDMALLLDVLEHIDDDAKALRNISSILKEDGILVVMVPATPSLYGKFDKLAFHKRRYSARQLREKLEESGFSVKKISYFMTFLFPAIYIFRKLRELFMRMRNDAEPDITDMAEIKVVPVLNEMCLATLVLESLLINKVNFPFGSSIVAVASVKKEGQL